MTRFLAYFLCFLLLLQTFNRELLVVNYQLQKDQITRLFCVNKDKPRLRCHGRCHLAKQLRKAADTERKGPPAGVAKLKYEVLPPLGRFIPNPQPAYPRPVRFAPQPANGYALALVQTIFRPPTLRA